MGAIPALIALLIMGGTAAFDPTAVSTDQRPTEIENMGLTKAEPSPAPSYKPTRLPAFIRKAQPKPLPQGFKPSQGDDQ
jgi:hypothetical protein